MTDDDEYRFYPEDFDEDGELIDDDHEFSPAPLVIVGSLGAGIALFVADSFADPMSIGGIEIELRSLSALVFALGLFTGSGVYAREGKRLLSAVHAFGSLGWVLLAFGVIFANDTLLVAGAGTLIVGAIALIGLAWRSSI